MEFSAARFGLVPGRHVRVVALQKHRYLGPLTAQRCRYLSTKVPCASSTNDIEKSFFSQSTSYRQTAQTHSEPPCSTATCTTQCTTRPRENQLARRALNSGFVFAAAAAVQLLMPEASYSSETLPTEFIQSWLDKIDSAGPMGPVFFILTVLLAEMIPLFPTQPLSLAGGLLFGAQQGGCYVLFATLLASISAFSVSRGVGRGLAERVIRHEMGEGEDSGIVGTLLKKVYDAIEKGNTWEQYTAVALLRLAPVVPFSATNYLLGLTPLQLLPFIAGSATGMGLWSFLYASVGGASRSLLSAGADVDTLFADMAGRASMYTQNVGVLGAAAGLLAVTVASRRFFKAAQNVDAGAMAESGDGMKANEGAKEKELETINDRV